jgi:hypothetical protein
MSAAGGTGGASGAGPSWRRWALGVPLAALLGVALYTGLYAAGLWLAGRSAPGGELELDGHTALLLLGHLLAGHPLLSLLWAAVRVGGAGARWQRGATRGLLALGLAYFVLLGAAGSWGAAPAVALLPLVGTALSLGAVEAARAAARGRGGPGR